ncbi:MAG: hypothetical protein ACE5D3_00870 [Candidatus Binatia bacterium]
MVTGRTARRLSVLVAVFALYFAACVDPQEISDIKTKVDEIQAQQKDIISKLDGIKSGQKQILAKAPAAARPSRPAEDPNKVYTIPKGNSFAKGAEKPTVTLVEFSDFQ